MASMIQKIVVPVDFSESCERATAYAWALARRLGASMHLIHVLHEPGLVDAPIEFYAVDRSALRERLYQDARVRLAQVVEELEPDINQVTSEVRTGPTIEGITSAAVDYGADLVIMGTHGRSGLSHLLLGSVAEGVIRTARCPVLVVRDSGAVHMHRRRAHALVEMAAAHAE
jgi:universal stress protein A